MQTKERRGLGGKKKWHLHGGDDAVIFAPVNNVAAEKKPGSSSHNVLNFQAKLAKNGLFFPRVRVAAK